MELAKMTSKGQLTVPVSIRKKLGIGAGDQLLFYEREGQIILAPVTPASLAAAQAAAAQQHVYSLEEIREIAVAARNPKQKWREFQNNGICSKYTKSGPGRSTPGPLSYVLSSIPSRCAAALAIVMCASIPTASKPSSAAAASVVPLPANGSRILPPGTHICTT